MAQPVIVPEKYMNSEPVAGQCRAEVEGQFGGWQCTYKSGHGPNGNFCKRHAKKIELNGYSEVK